MVCSCGQQIEQHSLALQAKRTVQQRSLCCSPERHTFLHAAAASSIKLEASKLRCCCTEYSNSNRAHPLIVIQKGQLCVFRLLLLLRSQLLDDIKVSTTSAETTITEQKWRAKTRDGEKEKKKGKAAVCTASARPFLDLASPSFSFSHTVYFQWTPSLSWQLKDQVCTQSLCAFAQFKVKSGEKRGLTAAAAAAAKGLGDPQKKPYEKCH